MSISASYPPAFRRAINNGDQTEIEPALDQDKDIHILVLDLERLDEQILTEACKESGIFRLENHGVPLELTSQLQEISESLLSLSFEEKQELFAAVNSPLSYFWGTPALNRSGDAFKRGTQASNVNMVEGFNVPLSSLSKLPVSTCDDGAQHSKLEPFRLDHGVRDFLEAKHEKKAMVAAQEDALRSKASVTNKDPPPRSINRPGGHTRHSPRREARFNPYSRRAPDHQTRRSYSRDPPRDMPLHSQHHSHYRQEQPRRSGTSVVNEEENYSRQPRDGHLSKRYKSPPRRDQRTASGDSHSASSPRPWKDERRESQGRVSQRETINSRHTSHAADSRGIPRDRDMYSPVRETLESTRKEVHDVMLQYTNNTDPAESAARRERFRQAEAQGRLDASDARILQVRQEREETRTDLSPTPPTKSASQDRVPLASRLGPLNQKPDSLSRLPIMDRLGPLLDEITEPSSQPLIEAAPIPKRKPGRPPGSRKANASPSAKQVASVKLRKLHAKPPKWA
ncbi:hypothetical protein HID58_088234 [Brassica napus]|uniref:Non-haem dioxygenase N-terminal domain-containing protein n=2 Tax=Brassica TaxID=3705 RepID=A0ABQ7XVM3_BRANA|nr:hypothetical protein HID58_088234 [Brassica napus]